MSLPAVSSAFRGYKNTATAAVCSIMSCDLVDSYWYMESACCLNLQAHYNLKREAVNPSDKSIIFYKEHNYSRTTCCRADDIVRAERPTIPPTLLFSDQR